MSRAKTKPKNVDESTIRKDLTDQLQANGTVGGYYDDLAESYIKYWKMQNDLQADINDRGVKVEKLDSRGQEQIVNNESIDQLLKVHKTMLNILDALGVHAVDGDSVSGGDEDDL